MPARRRLALLATLVLSLAAAPLASGAQDLRAAVLVNNAAVTRFEIQQRLAMGRALRAPADPASVERDLIDERLKVQEARRMGIVASDAAIRQGMEEFASRGGLTAEGLTAQLAAAGIEPQTFRDFVAAGVVWREVLRQHIAPTITVSDREIAQVQKRVIETPRVTEVLISEIIIPAPAGSEARVLARAEELSATVRSEAAFAAAARRLSATPSAGNGGRLPWTPVDKLPNGLAPILLALQPGQITQPLTIPGAVVLFYLRDTRGVLRPGARDETVEYARVTLPSRAQAGALQATADTCDVLEANARGIPVERASVDAAALPGDLRQRLARLDANEAVVIDRGGAAEVLMLCRRTPTLLLEAPPVVAGGAPAVTVPAGTASAADEAPLPTAQEVRERIFTQKVTAAEQVLLAELRANAIIRRP